MPDNPALNPLQNAELERERLNSLVNSMGDGVIATDERTLIALYNGAALNILDMNTAMMDKPVAAVMRLIDKDNNPIDITAYIRSTRTAVTNNDFRLVYSDKSTINVSLSIAPVRAGYGQTNGRGYVILLRDITHEKSLEEERDEFISVASHELRTPITIAEGNIGNALLLAKRSGGDPEIEHALKQAHDQVLFLSSLINDLATLSRAERGKLEINADKINAFDLVYDLAATYEKEAKVKSLMIKTELDPELEIFNSSKLYVGEILQNFMTNAIKYTEKGSITIGAKPASGGVMFYVRDTGIGISKGDQEKVFQKFFRSEDYRTRKSSGTGLGLYVTRKLADILHAQITLESELNAGTTFSIFIPDLGSTPTATPAQKTT